MNCPWCNNPLTESDEDYVFACCCIDKTPSCHAVIVNNKLQDFILWYPPKHLSLIYTDELWCVYLGQFSNEKIGSGYIKGLTLTDGVATLKRYINLAVFL